MAPLVLDVPLMRKATVLFACVVLTLASIHADAARPRVARLRRLVVIGDSLLAGFGSGGYVGVGRPGQVDSAPVFIARRARVRLPLPLMSRPGVPPQVSIHDDDHNGRLDPGEVRPNSSGLGFRDDPDVSPRNLAVPGEDSASVLEKISPRDVAAQVASGNLNGRDALKFLVLGLPLRDEPVSQVSRARELQPSFLLVWIGNNDLLDMATRTDPNALLVGPNEFGGRFRQLLDALADTGAGMAVANLPDPTGVAALRHAAGEVTSCRTAAGETRAVASDDLLSISLDRALLPIPPCSRVLDATERATVRSTTDAFNAQIAGAVAATEQARGVTIALVDVAARFDDLRAHGVAVNGTTLTTGYLGGIFSLDGIHPTRTGNAVIANAFIEAIDARFGEQIPLVDVARVASRDPLAHSRYRPSGEPPFGVVREENTANVGSYFDGVFARVVSNLGTLGNRLKRFFDRFF